MRFDCRVAEGVLQVRRPETRWLSTGWSGGFSRTPAAYNVSVPEGWERIDLDAYVAERRTAAGFDDDGPALLTGVDLGHARAARADPVVAVATAGVSNPAALPIARREGTDAEQAVESVDDRVGRGTVNVVLGTTQALDDGALANLVAVAVEAKTATLLATTGFPGTTTDAVVAGSALDGDPAQFSGSATTVGSAARVCVRDAVRASVESRYDRTDAEIPKSVASAEHGVVTDRSTEVFTP